MALMQRIHPELSDLFFNHEHEHRAAYYASTDPEDRDYEAERAETFKDAVDFCEHYPQLIDFYGNPSPADLCHDFFERL